MVVRKRLRAVFLPLLLYVASGSAAAYFVWSAHHGPRGLKTKAEYQRDAAELKTELNEILAEKARWSRRVAQLTPPRIDRDLLEEEARNALNKIDRRDVVIFLDQPRR
jgi:cell division protein FtsB